MAIRLLGNNLNMRIKTLLVIFILNIICNGSFASNSQAPAPIVLDERTVLNMILTFLKNTQLQKSQMEADLIYDEAPGGDDKAIELGKIINTIDWSPTMKKYINEQQVNAINFGLYYHGMTGSEPKVELFDDHSRAYCATDVRVEREVFESCAATNLEKDFHYGDLKLSNLLLKDSLNDEFQIMAESLIRNIVNPFPKPQTSRIMYDHLQKLKSSPNTTMSATDKRKIANELANETAFGVARHSLFNMFAERIKQEYTDASGNVQKISVREALKNEVNRRFNNNAWFREVTTASQEALTRERLHMEAFKLWLMQKQYEQNERIEALLATQVSLNGRLFSEISRVSELTATINN